MKYQIKIIVHNVIVNVLIVVLIHIIVILVQEIDQVPHHVTVWIVFMIMEFKMTV